MRKSVDKKCGSLIFNPFINSIVLYRISESVRTYPAFPLKEDNIEWR